MELSQNKAMELDQNKSMELDQKQAIELDQNKSMELGQNQTMELDQNHSTDANKIPKHFSQIAQKLRPQPQNLGWTLAIILFFVTLVLLGVILWLSLGSDDDDFPTFLPPKKVWIDEEALRNLTINKLNLQKDPCRNFVAYACSEEDEPRGTNEANRREIRSVYQSNEPFWFRTAFEPRRTNEPYWFRRENRFDESFDPSNERYQMNRSIKRTQSVDPSNEPYWFRTAFEPRGTNEPYWFRRETQSVDPSNERYQMNRSVKRAQSVDQSNEPYWFQTAIGVYLQCVEHRSDLEIALKEKGRENRFIEDYFDKNFLNKLHAVLNSNIGSGKFAKLSAILRRDYGLHFPFKLTIDFLISAPDSLIPWSVWKYFNFLSQKGKSEILKIRGLNSFATFVQFENRLGPIFNNESFSYREIFLNKSNSFQNWNWTEYFSILGAENLNLKNLNQSLIFYSDFDFFHLISFLKTNSKNLADYLYFSVLYQNWSCDKFFAILPILKTSEFKTKNFELKLKFLKNLAKFFKNEFIKFSGRLLGQMHKKEIEKILQKVEIQIGTPNFDDRLDSIFKQFFTLGKNFSESFFAFNQFLSKIMLDSTTWDLWSKISIMVSSPMFYYSETDSTIYFTDQWLSNEFVNLDLPYAAIAAQFFFTLGHELTHTLYTMPYRPRFSNLSSIGVDSTILQYSVGCVQESYTQKMTENETFLLPGSETFSEDVADLLGLLISFNVYQKYLKPLDFLPPDFDLTHEQLFFATLGRHFALCSPIKGYRRLFSQLAGGHSEGWVRLETLLKNIPQFSNAFSCTKDAPMNSNLKCASLFGFFDDF